MFSVRPFLIRIRRLVITKQFVPANIPGMSLTRSLSGTLKIIDVFALGGGRICPSAVSFGKILHSRECFLPSREASCKPFCTEIFSGCRIILHLFRHSARYLTHGNPQCVLAISSGSVGCVGENHEKKYRERKWNLHDIRKMIEKPCCSQPESAALRGRRFRAFDRWDFCKSSFVTYCRFVLWQPENGGWRVMLSPDAMWDVEKIAERQKNICGKSFEKL